MNPDIGGIIRPAKPRFQRISIGSRAASRRLKRRAPLDVSSLRSQRHERIDAGGAPGGNPARAAATRSRARAIDINVIGRSSPRHRPSSAGSG